MLLVSQVLANGTKLRTVEKRHGILMKFKQEGHLGRFSLNAAISRLVIGLGSLALITSLIDFMWSFVFPVVFGLNYSTEVYKYCQPVAKNEPVSKRKQR